MIEDFERVMAAREAWKKNKDSLSAEEYEAALSNFVLVSHAELESIKYRCEENRRMDK